MREIYAQKAISQIPRLLSTLDRNSFSPSYGCFSREYWLTRTRDFPDAIAQFGTLSLALVWAYKFPEGEQYYQNKEIKEWVLAGIKYWTKIQHGDGSFDEFYPNERGWAGPTGFLLYAMLRSYELLGAEFPEDLKDDFFIAVEKSAWFLATREEPGVLANHYAMALLPIYQTYYHLKDKDPHFAKQLIKKFNECLESFLRNCHDEGWSLEYDGADPGYLSATVSFLSKMQKYADGTETWKVDIQKVIDKAVKFSSYFLYPNGSYGGTIGSRQTLHFYAHGYELQASSNPLASACAKFGLTALREGKLVSPEIQDDRYYLYRVPEFLEAYIDSYDHKKTSLIPFQKEPFEKHFIDANIFIKNTPSHYMVLNFAKGGVLKIFDKKEKKLVFSDDGMVIKSENGKTLTTQWVGKEYKTEHDNNEWTVSGNFHAIPFKYFTPITMIGFRIFMLATGWNSKIAELIKGIIRSLLMTRSSKSKTSFERKFIFGENLIIITNRIKSKNKIANLRIGGQFASRYVPQSRYFQFEELDNSYWESSSPDISKPIEIKINLLSNKVEFSPLLNN